MFSRAIILLVALVVTRCNSTALRSAEPAAIESSLKGALSSPTVSLASNTLNIASSIEDLTSVKSARASHSMILKKIRSGGMSFGGTHHLSAQAVISSSSVPTGYVYLNTWVSSTSCSGNVDVVDAYPLGVCFTSDGGNSDDDDADKSVYFQTVTASGTSITRTYYTDATCTTACGTGQTCTHSTVIYTTDSCGAGASSSGKTTYSTSLTYPSASGNVNKIFFSSGCTSTVMAYYYIKSGYCYGDGSYSTGYTCSGTTLTSNFYSGSTTCSGSWTSSSTSILTTTCTSMKGYNETSYENYETQSCTTVTTAVTSTDYTAILINISSTALAVSIAILIVVLYRWRRTAVTKVAATTGTFVHIMPQAGASSGGVSANQ